MLNKEGRATHVLTVHTSYPLAFFWELVLATIIMSSVCVASLKFHALSFEDTLRRAVPKGR